MSLVSIFGNVLNMLRLEQVFIAGLFHKNESCAFVRMENINKLNFLLL